jgi:hypothetical protein
MRSLLRSLPVGAGTWLLLTAACTSVHTVQSADLSPPNPPTRLWVMREDHSTVVVDYPRVSADSLIGVVRGWPERLPLSEVAVLRVREPAPDRTAALVFGAVVAAGAVSLFEISKGGCTLRPGGDGDEYVCH